MLDFKLSSHTQHTFLPAADLNAMLCKIKNIVEKEALELKDEETSALKIIEQQIKKDIQGKSLSAFFSDGDAAAEDMRDATLSALNTLSKIGSKSLNECVSPVVEHIWDDRIHTDIAAANLSRQIIENNSTNDARLGFAERNFRAAFDSASTLIQKHPNPSKRKTLQEKLEDQLGSDEKQIPLSDKKASFVANPSQQKGKDEKNNNNPEALSSSSSSSLSSSSSSSRTTPTAHI